MSLVRARAQSAPPLSRTACLRGDAQCLVVDQNDARMAKLVLVALQQPTFDDPALGRCWSSSEAPRSSPASLPGVHEPARLDAAQFMLINWLERLGHATRPQARTVLSNRETILLLHTDSHRRGFSTRHWIELAGTGICAGRDARETGVAVAVEEALAPHAGAESADARFDPGRLRNVGIDPRLIWIGTRSDSGGWR